MPPGKSVATKIWWRMSSSDRQRSSDAPLPAYAYLCRSALIDVTPGPLEPRQDEATDTGIDVQRQAVLHRERAELGDRIDHAMRILRRRGDEADRAPADRLGHRANVGAHLGVDLALHELHAEVVRRLVERRVDRARH